MPFECSQAAGTNALIAHVITDLNNRRNWSAEWLGPNIWNDRPPGLRALRIKTEMHSHEYFDIPIGDVIHETGSAISIVFDVPQKLAETFRYRPGQFLTMRVLVDGKYRHRCYSLASAPGVDARHKVTVKRVDQGLVSNELCSNAKVGQVLQVQPPAGLFVPADLNAKFLLLAGGSGITPILSIAKSALADGHGHIALFYANRDEASVIFRDELNELCGRYPSRLTMIHWLETVQGLPTSQHLAGLLKPFVSRDTYICGPAPFMDAAVDALTAIGVSRQRIHLERFISLPDEDAEGEPSARQPAASAQGGKAVTRLTVLIDGKQHEIHWSPNQKMLDAMIAAGIDAPYSCRVGGCSACMCRVTEGEVTMAKNLVLDEQDLAEGWVLACQGQPNSAQVRCQIP